MGRFNPCNPVAGPAPLIHEVHGEPYKIVKMVYSALPWLWAKLGALAGSIVSTFYVKATLTQSESTQVIPYPPGINMMNIRNSILWVLTNPTNGAEVRRYIHRNCYLNETGLVINIDQSAPQTKAGAKVIWNIMVANRPWGKKPHGDGFFQNAWNWQDDDCVPPFHWAGFPPMPPGVPPCPPQDGFPPMPPFPMP